MFASSEAATLQRSSRAAFDKHVVYRPAGACHVYLPGNSRRHLLETPFALRDLRPVVSASQSAQVLTGLEPRRLPLRLMPGFKFVAVAARGSIAFAQWSAFCRPYHIQGLVLPQGSKLLPASSLLGGCEPESLCACKPELLRACSCR